MEYLLIAIAVVLIGCQFNLNKLFQKKYGSTFDVMLPYVAGLGIFAALFFFFLNGCKLEFSAFSVLMALAMAAIITVSHILAVTIMKMGKVSVYSTFMMLGGMMLPFIAGLIFLDEKLTVARIIGMIILVISLIVPVIEKVRQDNSKQSKWFFVFCGLAFVINGFSSITSKFHQINPEAVNANSFLVYTYGFSMLLGLAAWGVFSLVKRIKKSKIVAETLPQAETLSKVETATQTEEKPDTDLKVLKNTKIKRFSVAAGITAATSLIAGVGYLCQLYGAVTLDASVLYPMVTGGSIITSTIIGRIAYKEKISKLNILSIVLTLVGTILFLF